MNLGERYWGCMLGQAVGDAMGSSLEFNYPGCFEPIAEMIGGGPFSLNPGEWTIWLAFLVYNNEGRNWRCSLGR